MSLAQSADAVNGALFGSNVDFSGVGTDTRRLSKGDLFVALTGPHYDGHDFLQQAADAGAVAAMVSRKISSDLPHIEVADTRLALGRLAQYWRDQFQIPVIAVTGSNGKTTVKEMIASIMGQAGEGCVTQGNLNNDIGVPVTLLRMRSNHRFAVIEMGMNHLGEIAYLSELARPTVALITNAAEAHLEGLGSVEKVAEAKGEIFKGALPMATAIPLHAGLGRISSSL